MSDKIAIKIYLKGQKVTHSYTTLDYDRNNNYA